MRSPSGSTYGGVMYRLYRAPQRNAEELWRFDVDWSREHLVTKEAKPWAPEDVQRWRRWHVYDVLVAVVLLLPIGCYRRLPSDLLGSSDHVKKRKKRPKSFSENSAKAENHCHGVLRCWVSRFMRVWGLRHKTEILLSNLWSNKEIFRYLCRRDSFLTCRSSFIPSHLFIYSVNRYLLCQ